MRLIFDDKMKEEKNDKKKMVVTVESQRGLLLIKAHF